MSFMNGDDAQDAVISEIQRSSAEAVIRLMAYTFDYGPIVAALCAAKASAPERRIEVVMDRLQTLSGPTVNQNSMARQLIAAGIQVRFSRGKRLTPVYDEAGRSSKLGSLMGALHAKAVLIGKHAFIGSTNWTVSSRANHECSVHVLMDESTAGSFHSFFDIVWTSADCIDTRELLEKNNERIRLKAAKVLAKARETHLHIDVK
jgi:phosphatidylserine/phosphatidylglycerophosphate/cardiolipin synthase-like enzyme